VRVQLPAGLHPLARIPTKQFPVTTLFPSRFGGVGDAGRHGAETRDQQARQTTRPGGFPMVYFVIQMALFAAIYGAACYGIMKVFHTI
jgi:hypothetical protein